MHLRIKFQHVQSGNTQLSYIDYVTIFLKVIFPQSVTIYQHFGCIFAVYRRNCYLRASGENSDIVLRFSDPRRYFQMFLL